MSITTSALFSRRAWAHIRLVSVLAALASALVAVGCDHSPTAPTTTQTSASNSPTVTSVTYTLIVQASPPAGGSITRSPNQSQFTAGTSVTLSAVPASGHLFAGWQGDASGSTNPITLKMDGNKSVTATFAPVTPNQYTLAVSTSPAGAGTVARAPDQPQYPAGATVTLTATAAAGCRFGNWIDGQVITTYPLTITLTANRSVVARFDCVEAPSVIAPATAVGVPASYTVSVIPAVVFNTFAGDRMELEESTDGSAFSQVATQSWISSLTVPFVRSPGTYRYRARVYNGRDSLYSAYSPVVSTVAEAPPTLTSVFNDTQDSMSIVSLKIDGVERLRRGEEVLPQNAFDISVLPGAHSYETVHGYFDASGRHDLYTRSGSYTQAVGTQRVTVSGRTLLDLLAPYDWTGTCVDLNPNPPVYYDLTLRFYPDGVRAYIGGQLAFGLGFFYEDQDPALHRVKFQLWLDFRDDHDAWLNVLGDSFAVWCNDDGQSVFKRSARLPSQESNRSTHVVGDTSYAVAPALVPRKSIRRRRGSRR